MKKFLIYFLIFLGIVSFPLSDVISHEHPTDKQYNLEEEVRPFPDGVTEVVSVHMTNEVAGISIYVSGYNSPLITHMNIIMNEIIGELKTKAKFRYLKKKEWFINKKPMSIEMRQKGEEVINIIVDNTVSPPLQSDINIIDELKGDSIGKVGYKIYTQNLASEIVGILFMTYKEPRKY